MKKKQKDYLDIRDLIARHPEGLSRGEIAALLETKLEDKTLQRRLKDLVDNGEVVRSGEKRGTRYYPTWEDLSAHTEVSITEEDKQNSVVFSNASLNVLGYLETPKYTRKEVSYNFKFLDNYVPNESIYVPLELRSELRQYGQRIDTNMAAGTYARQICQRLLIDLSYNSSRLEGNTYSELDTKRLVEDGIDADGKMRTETVMIMNHKEAILFLIENAQDIELNPFTIYNLHALLSQDLLGNPQSCGRIRSIRVEIGQSSYIPLENPHQLKEYLELLLYKSRKISDPYEQSFFLLVHLSYLQAFEDVNKRTSRLACNIPFIKNNLCPLSFTDLAKEDYLKALLMAYEKNDLGPMLDVFRWAYRRSCEKYEAVKESLGEIDAYRVQTRRHRKEVMGYIIRQCVSGPHIEKEIEIFAQREGIENTDKFVAMTLADLDALHEGAIVGLGITEEQFRTWKKGMT